MKIKRDQELNKGTKIKEGFIEIKDFDYPVFCFKYIHRNFHFNGCNDDERRQFLDKISQLSNMTWQEIQYSGRHGSGTEKINRSSLKVPLPSFITDDVDFLLCARFDRLKPFLFHRYRFVAHLIFIDPKMATYDH